MVFNFFHTDLFYLEKVTTVNTWSFTVILELKRLTLDDKTSDEKLLKWIERC